MAHPKVTQTIAGVAGEWGSNGANCQWRVVRDPSPRHEPLSPPSPKEGQGHVHPTAVPSISSQGGLGSAPLQLGILTKAQEAGPVWGWDGPHTRFHPKASACTFPPLAQGPTPSTQVHTHVLHKDGWRLLVSEEGETNRETALTPDLGHTPTALSRRTAQIGVGRGAGGGLAPGSPQFQEGRWRPQPL